MRTEVRDALVRATNGLLGSRQLNQLVRFDPVLRLVEERPAGTLLDAGSGTTGVSSLLAEPRTAIALDVEFDDGAGPAPRAPTVARVLGDVRALPFRAASADVVVAVDLLEHVPPPDRRRAVAELCRVARLRAVIACPTGTEALAADAEIASRLRSRGRQSPPWLQEHLDLGFPDLEELTAAAQPFGRVGTVANESISAHRRLILAELNPLTFLPLRLVALVLSLALRSGRRWARASARSALHAIQGRDKDRAYRTVLSVDVDSVGQDGRQNSL